MISLACKRMDGMINNILHSMEIYELEGKAAVFITTQRRKTKVHEKSKNGKFSPQGQMSLMPCNILQI